MKKFLTGALVGATMLGSVVLGIGTASAGGVTPACTPAPAQAEVSHTDYQYKDWNLLKHRWDYRWSHKNVGVVSIYDYKTWVRTGVTQKHVEIPAKDAVVCATGGVRWSYALNSTTGTFHVEADSENGGTIRYENSQGDTLRGAVTAGSFTRDGNKATFAGTVTEASTSSLTGPFLVVMIDTNSDGDFNGPGDQIGLYVNRPFDGILATVTGGDLQVV